MSSQHVLRGGTEPVVSGQAPVARQAAGGEVRWGVPGSVPMSLLHLGLRYTDQGGEEEEDYESEEQLQQRILTAALECVPAHGWTAEAIAEGAKVCMCAGGAAWPRSARRESQQPEQRAFFQPSSEPQSSSLLYDFLVLCCLFFPNRVEMALFFNYFLI